MSNAMLIDDLIHDLAIVKKAVNPLQRVQFWFQSEGILLGKEMRHDTLSHC